MDDGDVRRDWRVPVIEPELRGDDKVNPRVLPPQVRPGQQVYTLVTTRDFQHIILSTCNGCGAIVCQGEDTVAHDAFHARLDALEARQ